MSEAIALQNISDSAIDFEPPEKQGKSFIKGIMDGSCTLPINFSSLELPKPRFDEINQHCSVDVLPILFEEAPFSARLKYSLDNSRQAQDVYSISVLPEEDDNLQYASQLAFLSFVEVPNPTKDQMCMDEQLICQDCVDLEKNSADNYSPCIVEFNVEKEGLQQPVFNDESAESLKSESILNHLQKVLQRQASLKLGGKLMQLLMNLGTSRDKTVTERVHDTPSRWRRYKRVASFDSRKIVLLFSILSSFGTLVLICLTLRVRQSADSFIHV